MSTPRYVTLSEFKAYDYIDTTDEDEMLNGIICDAEDIIENEIGRLLTDFEKDGVMPGDIHRAILLEANNLYENRGGVSTTLMSRVPDANPKALIRKYIDHGQYDA